ncbi:MAG: GNAT family N-acetyltransferase [Bacteroidia bacterium]|nr:GNAT family N-acetyltransferase [Bacteroidia bacterium]
MVTYIIEVAGDTHAPYAGSICKAIEEAAAARGTGIARRDPAYIEQKMREGKAVIAVARDSEAGSEELAGFVYIETWSDKRYVANSGLIVLPAHRHAGLALRIKRRVFELSRERFPKARIFGITTSHAVMKINTVLGYVPAPFSELTADDEFWNGCRSCPNYDILTRTNRTMCLCTGMLFDPERPHPVATMDVDGRLRERVHAEVTDAAHPDHAPGSGDTAGRTLREEAEYV